MRVSVGTLCGTKRRLRHDDPGRLYGGGRRGGRRELRLVCAPLNRWFRDQMKHVHGVDSSQPGPQPKKVHDVQL